MTAILFPYRPVGTVLELWQWVTEVLEGKDGTEARRAIREEPRQAWEWTVYVNDASFNAMVRGQHSLTWLVPAWNEAEVTTEEIAADDSTVAVDTDVGDWRTTLMIWSSPTNNETIAIASVGDDVINLSTNVVGTYPAGSIVAPIRTARLDNQVSKRDDKNVSFLSLTWLITDATALTGYDWGTQYDSDDVITDLYLMEGEFVNRTLQASVEEFDWGTGAVGYEVQYDPDVWSIPAMKFQASTAAEIWKWKTWIHKMQGRYGAFWLPTWKNEIELAATFTDSAVTLTIVKMGYVDYLDALDCNKTIYFQRAGSSTSLVRTIVDSAAIDDDTEQIEINSALGFAGRQSSFVGIHWLHPCRLDADQIELAYEPGLGMSISLPVRELVV